MLRQRRSRLPRTRLLLRLRRGPGLPRRGRTRRTPGSRLRRPVLRRRRGSRRRLQTRLPPRRPRPRGRRRLRRRGSARRPRLQRRSARRRRPPPRLSRRPRQSLQRRRQGSGRRLRRSPLRQSWTRRRLKLQSWPRPTRSLRTCRKTLPVLKDTYQPVKNALGLAHAAGLVGQRAVVKDVLRQSVTLSKESGFRWTTRPILTPVRQPVATLRRLSRPSSLATISWSSASGWRTMPTTPVWRDVLLHGRGHEVWWC